MSVPPGRRVDELARQHPARAAIVAVDRRGGESILTWAELADATNRAARVLARHGVDARSRVALVLPGGAAHFVATLATWRLGATIVPMDPDAPSEELDALLAAVRPEVTVVADGAAGATGCLEAAALAAAGVAGAPLAHRGAAPRSISVTGGSSGRPKLILRRSPWCFDPNAIPSPADAAWGFRREQTQLVAQPLFHGGFSAAHIGLFLAHTLVVMERFSPRTWVELVRRHRVQFAKVVPTMMKWIADLPDVSHSDLASLDAVLHGTAPCPPGVKRTWLALIDPEKLLEGYGAQEQVGGTLIRGDEWLERPGSVGRALDCDIRILGDDGTPQPPGTVGGIYLRRHSGAPSPYLGAPPLPCTSDGFVTVGDLGWLDDDGYLFLAGREDDRINVGGLKVDPSEVEAVLASAPGVRDAAVIGTPHRHLGECVRALIEPSDPGAPPPPARLHGHCRARLTSYKLPLSYDVVAALPRTSVGKLRRTALAALIRSGAEGR